MKNKLFLITGLLTLLMSIQTNTLYAQVIGNDSLKSVNTQSICAFIPNNFTPDRDGFDDVWCIKTSGADKCILWLWNRWGTHIFWDKEYDIEENGTTPLWYNGIGNGGTQYPQATYDYLIVKNTTTGEIRHFQGSVQIWGNLL